jgi:hypothetical protein
MPKNTSTFSNLRPSKIYPNWDFWVENKRSGNPGPDLISGHRTNPSLQFSPCGNQNNCNWRRVSKLQKSWNRFNCTISNFQFKESSLIQSSPCSVACPTLPIKLSIRHEVALHKTVTTKVIYNRVNNQLNRFQQNLTGRLSCILYSTSVYINWLGVILLLKTPRVARWACEKIAQNAAQPILGQNNTLLLPRITMEPNFRPLLKFSKNTPSNKSLNGRYVIRTNLVTLKTPPRLAEDMECTFLLFKNKSS